MNIQNNKVAHFCALCVPTKTMCNAALSYYFNKETNRISTRKKYYLLFVLNISYAELQGKRCTKTENICQEQHSDCIVRKFIIIKREETKKT